MDEVSRLQLDRIKARTMYNMVEPLGNGSKKMLFLTNAQAILLSKTPASLQKMLDRLEVGTPQLVINLLESRGFGDFVRKLDRTAFTGFRLTSWAAGIKQDKPPFLTLAEEMRAESKIDTFMNEIMLPLAAETNAIVLCNAIPGLCKLSSSFLKMYAATKAKWGSKPPFTVLSMSCNMWYFYANKNPDACWRTVAQKSKAWAARDKKIKELVTKGYGGTIPTWTMDLDPNAMTYIIIDSVDEKKDLIDQEPFNLFSNELTRYLSTVLPSLALKTGFTDKTPVGYVSAASMQLATDSAQSGTPTILIDIRDRPTLTPTNDRQMLIEEAKKKFEEHCAALVENGTCESFDACTFAYFHDVLTGDGSASTTELTSRGIKNATNSENLPLHAAIALAQEAEENLVEGKDEDGGSGSVISSKTLRRATSDQIVETVDWLVDRYFCDAWELLSEEQKREGEAYENLYKDGIYSTSLYARTLMTSENMYHVNVVDMHGAKSLVNKLVRLDRLPKENSLEGLLILRSAWRDYDVAMHLATRHKCWSKCFFAVQLLLGWLVIALGAAASYGRRWQPATEIFTMYIPISSNVVFAVSLALAIILSVDSLTVSKYKWKQLRRGAGVLASSIWCYRTRVGLFALEGTQRNSSGKPEEALMKAVQAFRDDLAAGSNLSTSHFHRKHASSVYKHFQNSGKPKPGKDDYHSPVQPHRYISLRVEPTMRFYERRIPKYLRWSQFFKLVLVILSVAASAIARLDMISLVLVITGASAALTSWVEFSNMGSKSERYTRALGSLKNILDWWSSLSAVQKASRESIERLVLTCEGIISKEQIGWTSMGKINKESSGKPSTKTGNSRAVHPIQSEFDIDHSDCE